MALAAVHPDVFSLKLDNCLQLPHIVHGALCLVTFSFSIALHVLSNFASSCRGRNNSLFT